ncbi:hypothetical protein LXL04_008825 [Taraxacum kok-saghyz]
MQNFMIHHVQSRPINTDIHNLHSSPYLKMKHPLAPCLPEHEVNVEIVYLEAATTTSGNFSDMAYQFRLVGYPHDAPATVLFDEWFRFEKPSDRYPHNVALTTYFRLMVSSPKTRIRIRRYGLGYVGFGGMTPPLFGPFSCAFISKQNTAKYRKLGDGCKFQLSIVSQSWTLYRYRYIAGMEKR